MKKRVEFNPLGPHHFYIGIFMILLSLLMSWGNWVNWSCAIMFIAGSLIALDDLIEHTITGSTPLRIFFEKFLMPRVQK
jgi:hypothetical protein